MRLQEALTFQTQLSKQGNTKEAWEELIDKKGLPFMAMLRNLRNLLTASISEKHHDIILKRLRNEQEVSRSMQLPHRFLTAFLAVDAAVSGESFGKGGGKGKSRKNKGQESNVEVPAVKLSEELGSRYKDALECAIKLSVKASCPELSGKTLVLCDVSGSMRYNDFSVGAKSIGGVTTAADLATLLGLLLFYMARDDDQVSVALFSSGERSPNPLCLSHSRGLLEQFKESKALVADMGKATEMPTSWLESKLKDFSADRVVVLSDMLIGASRNHPGGGGRLQSVLREHRKSKPDCTLVCVDLMGSGATAGIDLTGDCGKGDVLLSGFSDHMLAYVANPKMAAQVSAVETILETVLAEDAEKQARQAAKAVRVAVASGQGTEGPEEEEHRDVEEASID